MIPLLANHALIICTKNRESVLNQQKIALERCVSLPQQIIIVDASNTQDPESHKKRYLLLGAELSILSTKEGLPKQRNAGILALNSTITIVHFLDDDYFPEANYFEEMARCFVDYPEISGFGALIHQQKVHKPRFFDPTISGTIASNGRTLDAQVYPISKKSIFSTRYFSGCSMSFRRSVFDEFQFNETLTGYAQDEDLDFCLRLNKPLCITPFTGGFHAQSEVDRISQSRFKKSVVINRFLVLKSAENIDWNRFDFLASTIIQLFILMKSPLKNRNLISGIWKGIFWVIRNWE